MTIGYPAGQAATRVLAQDRVTAAVFQSYFAALAPTASTQRWTYTVPAAKLAQIDLLWSSIVRLVVASALAINEQWVLFTPSGGAASLIADLFLASNTGGAQVQQYTPQPLTLFAGDTIALRNQNTDTGGQSSFGSALKGFEYSI